MAKRVPLFALLALPLLAFSQKSGSPMGQAPPKEPNTYHKVSMQLAPGAGAEEVRQALLGWIGWQADRSASLSLVHSATSPGGTHHQFAMTVQGIPVLGAEAKANVTHSSRILSLTSTLLREFPVPAGSFLLTESEVAQGMHDLHGAQPDYALLLSKAWWPTEAALLPAYRAEVRGNDHWLELIVDAQTGETLRQRDLSTYHSHAGGGGEDGQGFVFNPDPLTTAGVSYGGSYVDADDADVAVLNAQRQLVFLRDITFSSSDSMYHLEGPYVKLEDINNPIVPPASSGNANFFFTRSQQGFEDVMCYYHIDTFQRYIQTRGFTTLYSSPLRVDAHGMNGLDNSRFSYSGTSPYLEFGEGCVDDAEDADVIVHEYGHALSYSGSPGSNAGFERNGLDEGIGDYFATSYSKSLTTFRWADMFTWDGHNTCWPGRSANVTTTYPVGGGDFYKVGEVWNSTLMQVQQEIGRFAMDKIQLQELFMNSTSMTLTDAARLCIDADTMLYGGWYTPSLQHYFCARGILTGAECIVSVQDGHTQDFRWDVFPNPTGGETHLSLAGLPSTGTYTLTLQDLQGRTLQVQEHGHGIHTLDLTGLDAGVYLARVTGDGEDFGVKKVVVW